MEVSGSDRVAAAEQAAMRVVPPPATLSWLLTQVDAAELVSIDAMRGGATAAMHRVRVRRAHGADLTVVLRRYVIGRNLIESPAVAEQEMTALGLVAESPVPTPELLAADPRGHHADAPAIAMSFLDGKPVWEPPRSRDWIAQVGEALIGLHELEIPDQLHLPEIGRYHQASYAPPKWAAQARVWETAVEVFHGPIPDVDVGFVHRDFHPGNVLWRRNELVGVVDWQAACRGPASIDPAHFRMNLLFYDATLAEQFRVTWERRSGQTFHPWADVMCIIGALDMFRDHPPNSAARDAIETTLADAVDALG